MDGNNYYYIAESIIQFKTLLLVNAYKLSN